jgi:hypothetical protein
MERRNPSAENVAGVQFVSMESGKSGAENVVGVPFVSMESGNPVPRMWWECLL